MEVKNTEIIKHYEGLRLVAYLCPASVWTNGYGHTENVKEGDKCTIEQAEKWLIDDCSDAENAVNKYCKYPLNQNQFDALVSFVYNLGGGNFKSSTLLKKLNKGDYIGAANEFKRWNKGGGKVLAGLVKRRQAETNLFIGVEK